MYICEKHQFLRSHVHVRRVSALFAGCTCKYLLPSKDALVEAAPSSSSNSGKAERLNPMASVVHQKQKRSEASVVVGAVRVAGARHRDMRESRTAVWGGHVSILRRPLQSCCLLLSPLVVTAVVSCPLISDIWFVIIWWFICDCMHSRRGWMHHLSICCSNVEYINVSRPYRQQCSGVKLLL